MNDWGRGVIITAAMNDHPQVRHWMHSYNHAKSRWEDCFLGVLHLELHDGDRLAAVECKSAYPEVRAAFEMSGPVDRCEVCGDGGDDHGALRSESSYAVHLQDVHGMDFLGIERKIGHRHERVQEPVLRT